MLSTFNIVYIMKTKNLISLTIAFCFVVMATTGLFLYFGQKEWHAIETLHILFGVIFLGFAIFHILNNWSSIKGYSRSRKDNKWQKEFGIAAGIFGLFLIGGAIEIEPFMGLAHGGKRLFGPKRERGEQVTFNVVKINNTASGKTIKLYIEQAEQLKQPEFAVWVEDSTHKFVETLFLPAQTVIAEEDANEPLERMIGEGEVEFAPFKIATLPNFNKVAASQKANYDKYTPLSNVLLESKVNFNKQGFLKLEIKDGDKVELYEGVLQPSGSTDLSNAKGTLLKKVLVDF